MMRKGFGKVGLLTVCALAAVAISGCTPKYTKLYQRPTTAAPSTPYKAGGLPKLLGIGIVVNPFEHPFGYQEEKLGGASFKVIVETNVVTPKQQTYDIAMMRLAELGQINGFQKFRVTNVAGGKICRDNVGVPRNIVVMFAQYGNGDDAVGPEDEELTKAVRKATRRTSQMMLMPVGKEYKVAAVTAELGEKLRNPDAAPESTEQRISAWEDFRAQCWGKS